MRAGKVLLLFMGTGLLLLTCSRDSNPTAPGTPSSTWTYTVAGSDLIINRPQRIDTYCDPTYGLSADTTFAAVDTNWYVLSAGQDTLWVEGDDPGDTTLLVRIGTGTGVQGQWRMIEGDLTATITVTATTITASMCGGDLFMATDGPEIEQNFNITVTKISCDAVLLTGNTTQEQVTFTLQPTADSPDRIMEFDATYSSNTPQHATVTRYVDPTTCPNNGPDWLNDFLNDNQ